jgi:hypothetical protein
MAIRMGWGNLQKTVIPYTFKGTWTWNELHAALDIAKRVVGTRDRQIRVIIDMTNADDLPSRASFNLNHMHQIKRTLAHYAESSRSTIVIVGAKPLITALWDTFRAVSASKLAANVSFAKTMRDAHRLLDGQVAGPAAS